MAKGQGRSYNQRLKLFHLIEVPVEKKPVVTDIHLLQEYGVEIVYDYKEQGYRIIDREFQLHELQLLIDSVQSSKFVTQKMAKELTDKLKKQVSRRSWGETSGKPADLTNRFMCFVTAFGSRGSNVDASEGNTKDVVRTVFG